MYFFVDVFCGWTCSFSVHVTNFFHTLQKETIGTSLMYIFWLSHYLSSSSKTASGMMHVDAFSGIKHTCRDCQEANV